MSVNERPLSPHLQIYKWKLTMLMSILHRVTGFGLALGALVISWWLLAAVGSDEAFAQFHSVARSLVGKLMITGWVWAFVYHFLNGIRHMVWDTGAWLGLKKAYASGWAVMFGSLLFTVAILCKAGLWS